jgi:bacterioferritin (cytochrome b1)
MIDESKLIDWLKISIKYAEEHHDWTSSSAFKKVIVAIENKDFEEEIK